MRILFVADVSIKNVIGGAERVLHEQTTRLTKNGHEVHVLTRKLPTHFSFKEEINGVYEHRYEINKDDPLTFLYSTFNNGGKIFNQLIKKNSFDLINFHQPFSALVVALNPASKKIKKIYTCHSLAFEEYQSRNKNTGLEFLLQINFRRFIEKYLMDKSQKNVVLSQYTKDKLTNLHKIPKDKIVIIPGGVDLIRFSAWANRSTARDRFGINHKKFVLFTVRNLVPRMGLENLVKAMAIIKEKIPEVYLVIGGDGPLKETLQSLIRQYGLESFVRLRGFIKSEDLSLYYQMADFFILPTIALEGFGLVTIESLSCGTPVLGTPVGGTKEILEKFDSSFLFKDASLEAIADLILKKYNYYKDNPEGRRQLSDQCRKFAEDNYSWELNIQKLEELFKQCAESAEK